jgi:hypothetical protein
MVSANAVVGQPIPSPCHGRLVLHDAEPVQEEGEFGGVFLAHGGDGRLEFPGQIERRMADRAQSMTGMADAQPAVVFGEFRVEHVEPAFDEPAATQVSQQIRGVGLFPGQARDRVGGGFADTPLVQGVPLEADELLRARPVEISRLDQVRGRGDGPRLPAPPAFFAGRGRLTTLMLLLNRIGGKSLRESRRLG